MVKTKVKPIAGTGQICVYIKDGLVDAVGDGLLPDIADLNIPGVSAVRHITVYSLEGKLAPAKLQRIGAELLADPITQEFSIGDPPPELTKGAWVVHVKYNHGVTDPAAESAEKGIADIGVAGVANVTTSRIYILRGRVSKTSIDAITRRLLANPVIQTYAIEKM
jgi:phosphoribosylformylglycinamidine (FGAM) synthase PurS component